MSTIVADILIYHLHKPMDLMLTISELRRNRPTLLRGLSPQANYTDRRLSAKLVPTCADRGCYVVSVTEPYGRILGFLNRKTGLPNI
jgi:hypothetical protein